MFQIRRWHRRKAGFPPPRPGPGTKAVLTEECADTMSGAAKWWPHTTMNCRQAIIGRYNGNQFRNGFIARCCCPENQKSGSSFFSSAIVVNEPGPGKFKSAARFFQWADGPDRMPTSQTDLTVASRQLHIVQPAGMVAAAGMDFWRRTGRRWRENVGRRCRPIKWHQSLRNG